MERTQAQNLKYPLLLVHGLFSSSWTWRKVKASFVVEYDLRYGGEFNLRPGAPSTVLTPGDFYTLNFSSNRSLSYRQQAEELRVAIDAILQVNKAKKIVIAGHSMGGLAGRTLIQILGDSRVHSLITLATPHYGSPIALLRNSAEVRLNSGFRRLQRILGKSDGSSDERRGLFSRFWHWLLRLGTDAEREIKDFFSSESFIELAPNSTALEELNRAPLPGEVNYVFIVASVPEFFRQYIRAFTGRFLNDSFAAFAEYASNYSGIHDVEPEAWQESDGAVPRLSQALGHFNERPRIFATLPVVASHNRITKRPAKLFHALALCGVIGSEDEA